VPQGLALLLMPPEFRLFCLALRRPQRTEDLAALRRKIADGPDWACVLEGARRHRVAPLLLAGLQACLPPDLPAAVVAELRRESLAAAAQSLAQMREIARLSRLFTQTGVRMLALKGVVLSAQLGEEPGLRNSRDIDLLVAPEEFAVAERLLAEAGYRPAGPSLSPRQDAAYRRWIKDAEFVQPDTGIRVELHHRLSDNPALVVWDFARLWHEREEVEIAGAIVAGLPRRYLGLYLCLHGAGHCWEELRWLVDLAPALREPGAVDAAVAAAQDAGLLAPMRHALILAHDWLGLPVAEGRLAEARADRHVRRLDRILGHFYVGDAWHRTPPRGSLAGMLRYSLWLRLYAYSLKADWRYRRHQAMREFIVPADWQAMRLPDRLFWLFPLVRPVGWLLRWRRR
jgi:hypothetical protein